jgi:uncharacterized protein (TIGR03435 family)
MRKMASVFLLMSKIIGLAFAVGLCGQSFEVASVRLNTTPAPATMGPLAGGERYLARNIPLLWLIGAAYGVSSKQISGVPAAMATESYVVEAKADHPVKRDVMMLMLRSLLEDRFKLVVRRETKELKAYVLMVAKGGPKIAENRDGTELAIRRVKGSQWTYHNMPMATFASLMAVWMDDIVVDGTGLKGSYDILLDYNPGAEGRGVREGRESAPDPNAPSLQSAIEEQLGLKLESRKGPVEMLVVDHIEKLSGN